MPTAVGVGDLVWTATLRFNYNGFDFCSSVKDRRSLKTSKSLGDQMAKKLVEVLFFVSCDFFQNCCFLTSAVVAAAGGSGSWGQQEG